MLGIVKKNQEAEKQKDFVENMEAGRLRKRLILLQNELRSKKPLQTSVDHHVLKTRIRSVLSEILLCQSQLDLLSDCETDCKASRDNSSFLPSSCCSASSASAHLSYPASSRCLRHRNCKRNIQSCLSSDVHISFWSSESRHISSLHQQLRCLWENYEQLFQYKVHEAIEKCICSDQSSCLNEMRLREMESFLDDAYSVIGSRCYREERNMSCQFHSAIDKWRRVKNFETKDVTSDVIRIQTNPCKKLLRQWLDFREYFNLYHTVSHSNLAVRNILVGNWESIRHRLKYVSSAYIERFPVDNQDKDIECIPFVGTMSISECHMHHRQSRFTSASNVSALHGMSEETRELALKSEVTALGLKSLNSLNAEDQAELVVVSVVDPETRNWLSLQEATLRGILDRINGFYVNRCTKENLPFLEAIQAGLINVKLIDSASKHGFESTQRAVESKEALLNSDYRKEAQNFKIQEDRKHISTVDRLSETRENHNSSVNGKTDDEMSHLIPFDDAKLNVSKAVCEKLKAYLNAKASNANNEDRNIELKVEEALKKVHWDAFTEGGSAECQGLLWAAITRQVDVDVAVGICEVLEQYSIRSLLNRKQLNPETCRVNDLTDDSDRDLSLAEAIESGKLDPKWVFFRDLVSGDISCLEAFIRSGRFNLKTARFVDKSTGEEISLLESIDRQLICPTVYSSGLAGQIKVLRMLNSYIDCKIPVIKVLSRNLDSRAEPCQEDRYLWVDQRNKASISLRQSATEYLNCGDGQTPKIKDLIRNADFPIQSWEIFTRSKKISDLESVGFSTNHTEKNCSTVSNEDSVDNECQHQMNAGICHKVVDVSANRLLSNEESERSHKKMARENDDKATTENAVPVRSDTDGHLQCRERKSKQLVAGAHESVRKLNIAAQKNEGYCIMEDGSVTRQLGSCFAGNKEYAANMEGRNLRNTDIVTDTENFCTEARDVCGKTVKYGSESVEIGKQLKKLGAENIALGQQLENLRIIKANDAEMQGSFGGGKINVKRNSDESCVENVTLGRNLERLDAKIKVASEQCCVNVEDVVGEIEQVRFNADCVDTAEICEQLHSQCREIGAILERVGAKNIAVGETLERLGDKNSDVHKLCDKYSMKNMDVNRCLKNIGAENAEVAKDLERLGIKFLVIERNLERLGIENADVKDLRRLGMENINVAKVMERLATENAEIVRNLGKFAAESTGFASEAYDLVAENIATGKTLKQLSAETISVGKDLEKLCNENKNAAYVSGKSIVANLEVGKQLKRLGAENISFGEELERCDIETPEFFLNLKRHGTENIDVGQNLEKLGSVNICIAANLEMLGFGSTDVVKSLEKLGAEQTSLGRALQRLGCKNMDVSSSERRYAKENDVIRSWDNYGTDTTGLLRNMVMNNVESGVVCGVGSENITGQTLQKLSADSTSVGRRLEKFCSENKDAAKECGTLVSENIEVGKNLDMLCAKTISIGSDLQQYGVKNPDVGMNLEMLGAENFDVSLNLENLGSANVTVATNLEKLGFGNFDVVKDLKRLGSEQLALSAVLKRLASEDVNAAKGERSHVEEKNDTKSLLIHSAEDIGLLNYQGLCSEGRDGVCEQHKLNANDVATSKNLGEPGTKSVPVVKTVEKLCSENETVANICGNLIYENSEIGNVLGRHGTKNVSVEGNAEHFVAENPDQPSSNLAKLGANDEILVRNQGICLSGDVYAIKNQEGIQTIVKNVTEKQESLDTKCNYFADPKNNRSVKNYDVAGTCKSRGDESLKHVKNRDAHTTGSFNLTSNRGELASTDLIAGRNEDSHPESSCIGQNKIYRSHENDFSRCPGIQNVENLYLASSVENDDRKFVDVAISEDRVIYSAIAFATNKDSVDTLGNTDPDKKRVKNADGLKDLCFRMENLITGSNDEVDESCEGVGDKTVKPSVNRQLASQQELGVVSAENSKSRYDQVGKKVDEKANENYRNETHAADHLSQSSAGGSQEKYKANQILRDPDDGVLQNLEDRTSNKLNQSSFGSAEVRGADCIPYINRNDAVAVASQSVSKSFRTNQEIERLEKGDEGVMNPRCSVDDVRDSDRIEKVQNLEPGKSVSSSVKQTPEMRRQKLEGGLDDVLALNKVLAMRPSDGKVQVAATMKDSQNSNFLSLKSNIHGINPDAEILAGEIVNTDLARTMDSCQLQKNLNVAFDSHEDKSSDQSGIEDSAKNLDCQLTGINALLSGQTEKTTTVLEIDEAVQKLNASNPIISQRVAGKENSELEMFSNKGTKIFCSEDHQKSTEIQDSISLGNGRMSEFADLKGYRRSKVSDVNDADRSWEMSIKEAVLGGVLDVSRARYMDLTSGQSFSMVEAAKMGLMQPMAARGILEVLSENSIGKTMMPSEVFPSISCERILSSSKETTTMDGAIKDGLVDPTTVFLGSGDHCSGLMSLEAAAQDGLYIPSTQSFRNPATGEEVMFHQAVCMGLIRSTFHVDDFMTPLSSVTDPSDIKIMHHFENGFVGSDNVLDMKTEGLGESQSHTISESFETESRPCLESLRASDGGMCSEKPTADSIGSLTASHTKHGPKSDVDLESSVVFADDSKSNAALLSSCATRWRQFDDLLGQLNAELSDIEKQVDSLKSDAVSDLLESVEMDALDELLTRLTAHESLLNRLVACSSELCCILGELGQEEQLHLVHCDTVVARDRYQVNWDLIVRWKQQLIDLMKSQIGLFDEWVDSGKIRLKESTEPVSLDEEKLRVQAKSVETLRAETAERKKRLGTLLDKYRRSRPSAAGEPDCAKDNGLLERFEEFDAEIKHKQKQFEDLSKNLKSIYNDIDSLNGWINDAAKSMKDRSDEDTFVGDCESTQIENLHLEKKLRKTDLDKVKKMARDVLDGPTVVQDEGRLAESLIDVHANYHDFSDSITQRVATIASARLDEMNHYLDEVESDLIDDWDVISADPDVLSQQLSEHQELHAAVESKCREHETSADKLIQMLHESINPETRCLKMGLENVQRKCDSVMKSSAKKLSVLGDLLPVAIRFKELFSDVSATLNDLQLMVDFIEVPDDGNLEKIKNELSAAKLASELVVEQRGAVEEFTEKGLELLEIAAQDDIKGVTEDMDKVTGRYDGLKTSVREKLCQLNLTWQTVATDVADAVDGCLDELYGISDESSHLFLPIACDADKLMEQINQNKVIIEDLKRCASRIENCRKHVNELALSEDQPEAEEQSECIYRLQDVESLLTTLMSDSEARATKLELASQTALDCEQKYDLARDGLLEIQRSIKVTQNDENAITRPLDEQKKFLLTVKEDLERLKQEVETWKESTGQLVEICGGPASVKVAKQKRDLESILEEAEEELTKRQLEADIITSKTQNYESIFQAIEKWLPEVEEKIRLARPVAADARSVRIQIEELKLFMRQLYPRYNEVEHLNNASEEIVSTLLPTDADAIRSRVKEINDRWNKVVNETGKRENLLGNALVELGELDQTLDDIIGLLQQIEADIQQMDDTYGDPNFIEMHQTNLRVLQDSLENQSPTVQKLNERIKETVMQSGQKSSPLVEKLDEMNDTLALVERQMKEKQNYLLDQLKEVKAFMGGVDDLHRWMVSYGSQLKSASQPGATPESAKAEYDRFLEQHSRLLAKVDEVEALMLSGEEMCSRCKKDKAIQLKEGLRRLHGQAYQTILKSNNELARLQEHYQKIEAFHSTLEKHDSWVENAEKVLVVKFKHASKLVDNITVQIAEHKELQDEINGHNKEVQDLDLMGSYLKYFGCKRDTMKVGNHLFNTRLHWKRLVCKTSERGRHLQQAYREDNRFYKSWKTLCGWLDETSKLLDVPENVSVPELDKAVQQLRHLQHQLAGKHPFYYYTLRLGRGLKDRCTASDPERAVLSEMLDRLKDKWKSMRLLLSKSEKQLHNQLMLSKRLKDAVLQLDDCLRKTKSSLDDTQNHVYGDLHTVYAMIEDHKSSENELEARWQTVQNLLRSVDVVQEDKDQLRENVALVKQMSEDRKMQLEKSLELAMEFNSAVQGTSSWLSDVETKVEEFNIVVAEEEERNLQQILDELDKFELELTQKKADIDQVSALSKKILSSCHPAAVKSVNYCASFTEAQYHKVAKSVRQKRQMAKEAIRSIQGNAAMMEDLMSWISEALALLASKEHNSTPDDLTTADVLLKEHLEFHGELMQKKKLVEEFIEPSTKGRRLDKNIRSSTKTRTQKANEDPKYLSPRSATLQNKWKLLWKLSNDRKRTLQQIFSDLIALKTLSSFDFGVWRQRYATWIRAKKFRVTDFFRHENKKGNGSMSRKNFIDGMMASKFPTDRTELSAVFDAIDKNRRGNITYHEFVEALKLEPKHLVQRPITTSEQIHDNIQEQVSRCNCQRRFPVQKIADGKYKFGERGKLCLVRFLNSTVMVRVGGGWVTLEKYLESNDPCRTKNRTNTELMERFTLPEGASQARVGFVPRKRSSTPNSQDGTSGSESDLRPKSRSGGHHTGIMSSSSGSKLPTSSKVPSGSRTSSGSGTPMGSRTPTMGSRTPAGHRTPVGSRTPSGSRTPTGLRTPRSNSPGPSDSASQMKYSHTKQPPMKF